MSTETIYHVTYRYGPTRYWSTRTMTHGEYLGWKAMVGTWAEFVVIPRHPKRIAPSHPKRHGGQIEGNPIKEGWKDRHNGNCRQFEQMGDSPPMRRTDIVALQSGGLSPAQIMAHARD